MRNRTNAGRAIDKIIAVNDKLGNTGIKNMQGTTRIIYDSLPLVVSPKAFTLDFFQDVNTRKFPFTNLLQNNLQVGETIVIEDYYFNLIEVDANNVIIWERPLEYFAETEGLYRSDLNFMIGESRVLKSVKVGSSQASFNYNSTFLAMGTRSISSAGTDPNVSTITKAEKGHSIYKLRTDLVIPPEISFSAPVQFSGLNALPAVTSIGNSFHIVLTMEGRGSLLAMRTTV